MTQHQPGEPIPDTKNPSSVTTSLDGDEWQHPDIFKSIRDLGLPYLKELLIALFTGADETWTHFTSEFALGGLIDAATTEERNLAWMPATRDYHGLPWSFMCL